MVEEAEDGMGRALHMGLSRTAPLGRKTKEVFPGPQGSPKRLTLGYLNRPVGTKSHKSQTSRNVLLSSFPTSRWERGLTACPASSGGSFDSQTATAHPSLHESQPIQRKPRPFARSRPSNKDDFTGSGLWEHGRHAN